jgi:hypothetical protein
MAPAAPPKRSSSGEDDLHSGSPNLAGILPSTAGSARRIGNRCLFAVLPTLAAEKWSEPSLQSAIVAADRTDETLYAKCDCGTSALLENRDESRSFPGIRGHEGAVTDTFASIFAWAEDHVRLFQLASALIAIAIGGGGFFLGWILRQQRARRERQNYRSLVNDQQIVFEAHLLREMQDGAIRLEVDHWGLTHSVSALFHDPVLEREVTKVARKRDGLVLIPKPGQLLMMASLRDAITGNDWTANPASLKGRAVEEDQVIIAPVSWPGLRENFLLRVVVLDADWVERLGDPAVVARIVAVDPSYQYRTQWLHEIALAWPQERQKTKDEATIWQVAIRSARWPV